MARAGNVGIDDGMRKCIEKLTKVRGGNAELVRQTGLSQSTISKLATGDIKSLPPNDFLSIKPFLPGQFSLDDISEILDNCLDFSKCDNLYQEYYEAKKELEECDKFIASVKKETEPQKGFSVNGHSMEKPDVLIKQNESLNDLVTDSPDEKASESKLEKLTNEVKKLEEHYTSVFKKLRKIEGDEYSKDSFKESKDRFKRFKSFDNKLNELSSEVEELRAFVLTGKKPSQETIKKAQEEVLKADNRKKELGSYTIRKMRAQAKLSALSRYIRIENGKNACISQSLLETIADFTKVQLLKLLIKVEGLLGSSDFSAEPLRVYWKDSDLLIAPLLESFLELKKRDKIIAIEYAEEIK